MDEVAAHIEEEDFIYLSSVSQAIEKQLFKAMSHTQAPARG